MSRPARIAIGSLLLSVAMAVAGYVIQTQNAVGGDAFYTENFQSFRADVRASLALDVTKEDILSNPKLDADRAELLEKIERHRASMAADTAAATK
jgi:hypothetical protein